MNAEIGTVGIIHNIDIAYNNVNSVSFFVLNVLLQMLLSSSVSFKKGYIYIQIYIIILTITKRLSSCIKERENYMDTIYYTKEVNICHNIKRILTLFIMLMK